MHKYGFWVLNIICIIDETPNQFYISVKIVNMYDKQRINWTQLLE